MKPVASRSGEISRKTGASVRQRNLPVPSMRAMRQSMTELFFAATVCLKNTRKLEWTRFLCCLIAYWLELQNIVMKIAPNSISSSTNYFFARHVHTMRPMGVVERPRTIRIQNTGDLRMYRLVFFFVALSAIDIGRVCSAAERPIPLNVLYLGRTKDAERNEAFSEYLSSRFHKCVTEKRVDFQKELLEGIDVVIVDWPQSERISNKSDSPIGPLEEWDKPTVFLGSAGLLMAKAWRVIGDAG